MNWLALAFALELGVLPTGTMVLYEPDPCIAADLSGYFYTDLEARVEVAEILYVGGGVRTYVRGHDSSYSYYPHDAYYRFEAGLAWRGLELFWRHYCIHPVVPLLPQNHTTAIWEGAYEEAGLRFSGTVPIWKGKR